MFKKITLLLVISSFKFCLTAEENDKQKAMKEMNERNEKYRPGGKEYCKLFTAQAEKRLKEIEAILIAMYARTKYDCIFVSDKKDKIRYEKLLQDLYFILATASLCNCEHIKHVTKKIIDTRITDEKCFAESISINKLLIDEWHLRRADDYIRRSMNRETRWESNHGPYCETCLG